MKSRLMSIQSEGKQLTSSHCNLEKMVLQVSLEEGVLMNSLPLHRLQISYSPLSQSFDRGDVNL